MRLQLSLSLVLFFTTAATVCAQSRPPAPEDDTQFWSDVQLTLPLTDKKTPKASKVFEGIDVVLLGTFRLGRDITRPVDERAAVGLDFKVAPPFKALPDFKFRISPSYLYQAAQPFEGRKGYESRFNIAVMPEYALGGFKLTDRNLVERRFRNSQPDSTRYRNRLGLEYETTFKKRKLVGYARDEVFYDWSAHDWVRNRFSVGTILTFLRDKGRYSSEVYYLRQNDGRARPGDLHVIGTTLRIQLKRLGRRDSPTPSTPTQD